LATVAFITESEAKHRMPYAEAIRDVARIEAAHVVDDGDDGLLGVIGSKLVGRHTSVDGLLATVRPDMAIVSLVASNSPPAIEALLDAGLPSMAEKPACVDPEDFAPLARLADEKGVPLMLALANRMRPDMSDARRIIAEGGIGELYAVRAAQVADQTRIQELTEPDWTFERARGGGGHLVWLGIHFVDVIRYVTGRDIEQVQALTGVVGGAPIDVEDLALVNMRLSGGALVSLFSGYVMEENGHQGLTIYGSRGWLQTDAAASPKLMWCSGRGDDAKVRRTLYEDRGAPYTSWVALTLRAGLGEVEPPLSAADGLAALRAVHAAYASAAHGRPESVA